MILRSIEVAGWRSILDPVVVGPFSEGLNVLHAPNGTGKSSLFEALRMALMDNHGVTGQAVGAIRPWGRSLAPRVTVAFCHGGVDYRITKQFVEEAGAKLERLEDGVYRPLAEGRKADEQVRGLFTKNAPGKGVSSPAHWGLAQVLWAPQGDLALIPLSNDLVADIRAALGAQVDSTATGPIEKRIEEVYATIYTPGGKYKSGANAPAAARLFEELERARMVLRDANDELNRFEEASREVEDCSARRAQARHDAKALEEQIKEKRDRAEAYRALTHERESAGSALNLADTRHRNLEEQIARILQVEREREEKRDELKTLDEDLPAKEKTLEERRREATEALAAVEDARKARVDIETARKRAEAARRYVSEMKNLAELDKRLERLADIEARLAEARNERASLLAPDEKDLSRIRKAINDLQTARVKLDASMITLEIVLEKDGTVEVVTGEAPGTRALAAGLAERFKGSPEIVADLKGVARLRASGPAADLGELRNDELWAAERVDELTRPYGTSDPAQLDALREKADALEKGVDRLEAERDGISDGEPIEETRRRRAEVEAALETIRREYPDWKEQAPEPDRLEAAARDSARAHETDLNEAERRNETARDAREAAERDLDVHRTNRDNAVKELARIDERWAEATRDGKSPEKRANELRELLLTRQAAKANLETIEAQIAGYDDDPVAELERLEQQLDKVRGAAEAARDAESRAEARLAGLADNGPYTAAAEAAETVARLEEEHRREKLRADGVKLLYDTVQECRAAAVASVSGPVEAAATRLLHRVAGRRLGALRLDANLGLEHVCPEVHDGPVAIGNLSGGEKEQIYLATRLALAEVLAKEERQLVVLDDVLTATDAGRLARVMIAMEEAAQRLQVLVLTCHPERYGALNRAAFIDLEALMRG